MHTQTPSLPTSGITVVAMFVTVSELALTHHHHPKSVVYIMVYAWCGTSNCLFVCLFFLSHEFELSLVPFCHVWEHCFL